MALAPSGFDWFQQWSPPAELFTSPRFQHHHHQQQQQQLIQPVVAQQTHYHQSLGPYSGYSYVQHQQDAAPEVQYHGIHQDRLHPGVQGHGIFGGAAWPPPTAVGAQRGQQPNSVVRILPTLLTLGMVGKLTAEPIRGDQEPPPNPDRDLGGPPPLRTLYHWSVIDYSYRTNKERKAAIDSGQFIPMNVLPLGIEAWKDRVFVTFPRWKQGVPCTLATVPRTPKTSKPLHHSPKLDPYPSWDWHRPKNDCSTLTSVFRINADRCGRLWVLDSGQIDALNVPIQLCPPQLFVFNLTNDALIGRFRIPDEHVRQNSLFTNIVTDIRDDKCDDVHAYFTDVWRFSIIVFRLKDRQFWRFNSHLFYPDPIASDYDLHGVNFQWSDGVFGISLTPLDKDADRTLFFHPMSSFREFTVPASVLRNRTASTDQALLAKAIRLAGESRGFKGQSSAEAISRDGVMFFNLVTRDAVGCWDTRKPYKKNTLGQVAQDSEKLVFPNDLKIDNEPKQSVWVLSNRLPFFLYRTLDPKQINFRLMREYVDEAVAGSVCDPLEEYHGPLDYEPECY